MKLPKHVLLYLLALEMLPLCDDLEVSKSLKKSVRNIERFARESFENMELHPELSDYINNGLVQSFSEMIDSIEIE